MKLKVGLGLSESRNNIQCGIFFHKNILFPIKYVNHLTTVKIVYTNVCTTNRGEKTHGCHVRPRTVGKRFDT